jgi:hypothetical protein
VSTSISGISDFYTPDATKANQLYKFLAKGTPPMTRHVLKTNNTLTNQVMFVTPGNTIGVITFPILTTDTNNRPLLIGTYGNDVDNMAPTAISGDLLNQSFSALLPSALATKFDLPVLTADPLNLDPPPPATVGAGPDRLHHLFTDPELTPIIAAIPAIFSVPKGIKAPIGWVLSSVEITEADFPCDAGRAWIKAISHSIAHHDGNLIHSDANTFNAADLDLTPFADHEMAPSIYAPMQMLNPNNKQYHFVQSVTREAIQAGRQVQGEVNPAPSNDSPARENAAVERQARVLNEIVKATIASTGSATKDHQSRTDKESAKAIIVAIRRYQLFLAELVFTTDPNNPEVQIVTVVLPEISNIFKEILDTSKVAEAVRITQEQFVHHLAQRSKSKNVHDALTNYDARALDAPMVLALEGDYLADRPLSIATDSINDKLGIYHFAPPRTGTYQYNQRVAEGQLIFRQEIVGEDKSRIKAKAHDLDHTGKMDTETDLHSIIANFGAVITFITKHANKSELWKKLDALHDVWLHADGRIWLEHHLNSQIHRRSHRSPIPKRGGPLRQDCQLFGISTHC